MFPHTVQKHQIGVAGKQTTFDSILSHLLIGSLKISDKISVHMIGIGGWLHLKNSWVHAQITKNCFVDIRLLGTTRGFIVVTHLAN